MPYSSACVEAVGFAIGADDHDPRRKVGVGRCVEQGPKIGPRARDEDGDREHRPSLPAAAGWACGGPGRRWGCCPGRLERGRSGAATSGARRGALGVAGVMASVSVRDERRFRRRIAIVGIRRPCAAAASVVAVDARRRGLRATSRREQQDRRAEQHLQPDGEGDGPGLRTDLGEPARPDRPRRQGGQQGGARGRQHGDAQRDDRPRADPIGLRVGFRALRRIVRALRRSRSVPSEPAPQRPADGMSSTPASRAASAELRAGSGAASPSIGRSGWRGIGDGRWRHESRPGDPAREARPGRPAAERAAAAMAWSTREARRARECREHGPSWVPAGETAVPVPTANPGPATNAMPQIARVGRYASCARVITVAPSAST